MSEADVGDTSAEAEPSHQYSLHFVATWQMEEEERFDRMASDMEVHMNKSCVIEFLHAKKKEMAPHDGDQTVDVNTLRRWVVRFSSGDSDVKDKLYSGWPCTSITPQNEEHLNQLICANSRIIISKLYRGEYWLQCTGNYSGNIGIL